MEIQKLLAHRSASSSRWASRWRSRSSSAARPLATLFSDDAAVVDVTVQFLRVIPISYTLLGVALTGATVLNALQRPWPAAGLAAVKMLGLLVPLAFLGGRLYGTDGVLGAVVLAYLGSGLLTWWWVRREISRAEARVPGGDDAEVPAGGRAKTAAGVAGEAIIGGHPSQQEVTPVR